MSEARSIGIAVVGLGFMGSTHIRAYQAAAKDGVPCRLVAVADRSADRLSGRPSGPGNLDTGASTELLFDPKQVRAYFDPREAFGDPDVDAVSICTHTDTHVDLAIAALRSGKHVLVEKPVAISSSEARRLADAAADSGKLCMPAMCMRFWPGWAWLKERQRDGTLGAIQSAVFQRLGSAPDWAAFYGDIAKSGGSLFDLHIHDTDFVRFLFGAPDQVVSTGSVHHVSTLYRYGPGGPKHVVAEGGQDHHAGFGFKMRYVVIFENATADFDLGRADPLLLIQGGKTTPVDLPPLSGYDLEIRHFVQAIVEHRRPQDLVANMDDAWNVTRTLEAERRSLETGAPVSLVNA